MSIMLDEPLLSNYPSMNIFTNMKDFPTKHISYFYE